MKYRIITWKKGTPDVIEKQFDDDEAAKAWCRQNCNEVLYKVMDGMRVVIDKTQTPMTVYKD
jgi:hypothetical protein